MRENTQRLNEFIDLQRVEVILNATLRAHPPKEDGYRLSPDSTVMAEIYGTMIVHGINEAPVSALSELELETFERWDSSSDNQLSP